MRKIHPLYRYCYIFLLLMLSVCLVACDMPFISHDVEDAEELEVDEPVGAKNNDKVPLAKDVVAEDKNAIQLSDNIVVLDIENYGRVTPFVPYKERNLTYSTVDFGDLPLPPLSGLEDENLTNLISAKVTGILYEKASPSAIINVLDEDYLVKKGDKIESFQIADIKPDYVSIKTGSNIFRAKVGDIVDGEVYGTGVYNLGRKFAGHRKPAREEDILVVKTKKQAGENADNKEITSFNDLALPPVPLPQIKINKKDGDANTPAAPDKNNTATNAATNTPPAPTANTKKN